jgi:hypothetical protein
MPRVIRLPSPALVVACIALMVALSGLAYAATLPKNSVGTTQLKNDAVVSSKVKNGALLAADFKAGQLPAGEVGPKGDKGDTGAQGPPGVSGLEIVKNVGPSQSTLFTVRSASCPSGKRLLGGGAVAFPLGGAYYDDIALVSSYPITNTTWQAVASEVNPTTGNWRLDVYAICANVGG